MTYVSSAEWLQGCVGPHLDETYPQFLRSRMVEPNKTALIYGDRSHSYAELHAAVDAIAQALAIDHGVRPGDRVIINMENSDTMMIVYLAVHRAGGTAIPINPKLVAREIAYMISDSRPVLYIGDASLRYEATEFGGIKMIDVGNLVRASPDAAFAFPYVAPDAPATIFYTSGTTGQPKGVVHTHRTLISGAFQCARGWGYDFPHTTIAITPFFHVAAHSWFYPVFAFNGTVVAATFKTDLAFDLIEKHRPQGFNAVPAMLLMLVASERAKTCDTSCVTNVCFGASPMPPERLAAVQQLFPSARFWHGMGQTESGGSISVLPPHLAFSKNGSTGFPIPGCEVRIVDDAGRDLGVRERGEVLARGPNVMVGYLDRPVATAETLDGGWLHTGDVGYVDEDGCIFLVDRKKDMIIRGGENVYSVEIENILMSHKAVEGCAVIGLPDPLLGERICAVLLPCAANKEALISELAELCRSQLAPFKVPEMWRFIDKLPATATGKIQKAGLRESLSRGV